MSKFIEIPLAGGLGNQLFQLAAGIEVARITGKQVLFSTTLLDIGNLSGATKRKIAISDLLEPHELSSRSLTSGLAKQVQVRLSKSTNYVFERGPADNIFTRLTSTTKYVEGYFQDVGNVNRSWEVLKNRFFRSEKFYNLVTQDRVDQIAVHMRYGDYASNSKARAYHGLTHPQYYVEGIRHLLENGSQNKVMLLSDDPSRALCDLNKFGLDSSVDIQPGDRTNEIRDLEVLAKSSSLVISNSSFSWWGALIASKRFQSQVIAPSPWFANRNIGIPNLTFEDWYVLERRIISE